MTFDHNQINSLMRWAALQAPIDYYSPLIGKSPIPRVPVRIEIGFDSMRVWRRAFPSWQLNDGERIVCKVYTMEVNPELVAETIIG